MPASSKGGVYESTKHGDVSTGVERISGEPKGDCTHCHDEHASRDGVPTPGGPYDYLLFKANDNNLCYTNDGAGPCHTSAGARGIYQGSTAYQSSIHGETSGASGFNPASGKSLPSCQACHNPHGVEAGGTGSPFASLLVYWAYGTGTNSSDEEFLCYGGSSGSGYCHSSSGPAPPVESAFEGTATASFDSKAINTHHDIRYNDQQTSGAKIECMNCHNAHVDNGTNPPETILVADPDPMDGRIPTAGNTWADSTFLSEWCLDCHDNSFPSTITPPTAALEDIYEAWVGKKPDQHGTADAGKGVSLRTGSGYARFDILQCSDCHVMHPLSNHNLFQLKSKIYSKDGLTQLESDDPVDPYGDVRVTNVDGTNTDPTTNGKYWCSTCHPDPMGGTKTKGCVSSNCHAHGAGAF